MSIEKDYWGIEGNVKLTIHHNNRFVEFFDSAKEYSNNDNYTIYTRLSEQEALDISTILEKCANSYRSLAKTGYLFDDDGNIRFRNQK